MPLVRTVEQVKNLVQSAKFPPKGTRGFGSPLAPERFTPTPTFTEYLEHANDALLTIVQIETREALEVVDEIAAVDGLDVLFVGPFDLGILTLLLPLRLRITNILIGNNIGRPILNGEMAPQLQEAIARILQACRKANKKCGIYSTGGEQANTFANQGFDMISVVTDYTALDFTVKEQLSIASSKARPKKGGSY